MLVRVTIRKSTDVYEISFLNIRKVFGKVSLINYILYLKVDLVNKADRSGHSVGLDPRDLNNNGILVVYFSKVVGFDIEKQFLRKLDPLE